MDENLANLYPELYKELTSGRSLSYRTFFVWVFVSIYQGGIIQGLSQVLTEVDGPRMVAVSYTVLVLNELLMVAMEITTWHPVMVLSIVGTFLMYAGSVPFLGEYFDLAFVITWCVYPFLVFGVEMWEVGVLTCGQGLLVEGVGHWGDFAGAAVCGQGYQQDDEAAFV